MRYRWFLVPTLVAVGITGVLLWRTLGDNVVFYLTPTEALARRTEFPDGERFRLGGNVVPGTLAEGGGALEFDVTDGGVTIPVRLTSTPPQLFGEDVPVLVEGAWNGEVFNADKALIKHDENYEAPDGGTYTPPLIGT